MVGATSMRQVAWVRRLGPEGRGVGGRKQAHKYVNATYVNPTFLLRLPPCAANQAVQLLKQLQLSITKSAGKDSTSFDDPSFSDQ